MYQWVKPVLLSVHADSRYKSKDKEEKSRHKIIFLSLFSAFVLATFTDIILSRIRPLFPQMAPIILLIPVIAIYHNLKQGASLKQDNFSNKVNYFSVITSVTIYVFLSYLQATLSNNSDIFRIFTIEESTFRGIVNQLMLFISVYLVIKENKSGFITSLLMNIINFLISLIYLISTNSIVTLPGIISYAGVITLIILIATYKRRANKYIAKISSQRASLEESERSLYKLAYYDTLTGLPNKDKFKAELEISIEKAKGTSNLIGVMFVDLDSFKSINDTMGHSTGDVMLKLMADRISSCLDKRSIVARFGGDEFLIKTENILEMTQLKQISDKIISILNEPITVSNMEYFISASIGVAVYPFDGGDTQTLIRNADIAMYLAKSKGKNQCIYSSSDMKNNIIKDLTLTNSLYRALDRNELFLNYQPQINTRTLEITGFEALLRWNAREYGLIPPSVFIPMAEQTGLIRQIGLWVMKTSCEQLKIFQKIYGKDLSISVNLSLIQLKDIHITENIKEILKATNTDAKYFHIEITESTAFNEEPYVLKRLLEIKNLGVSIYIDDFGTGHSSFSRLKIFPIDVLKIDMRFVHGISIGQHKDLAIIKSILQIAKNLGIGVIAEGVETKDQFEYLSENECDKIQGYYFYPPISAEQAEKILK